MKKVVKIAEMAEFSPDWLKDAFVHVAKDSGIKTDDLEMHRSTYSEKSKVNQIDSSKRQSLKYVSARTMDRDNEIVVPKGLNLNEFRKYMHVLVNHNYSLLPIGSDEMIEADDFGIKALTNHANTGEGTLANVVWHLVEQGHMKASSIGIVPTTFTKPGHRDWDTVANKLQSSWKEFSKDVAAKSRSRIITGGVLLEHSFVSVPCNIDAEMLHVVKGFSLADKVIKQLGWEPEVINKKEEEKKVEEKHIDKFDLTSEKKEETHLKSITVLSRNGHPVIIKEFGMGMENGKDEDGGYGSDSKEKPVAEMCQCPVCDMKRKVVAGTDCSAEGCKGKMKPVKKEEKALEDVTEESSLVPALTGVLTNTFAFYAQAHTAHWNVVGPDFTEWHSLFGEIYDDAWNAIDPMAENIRKLGESVPANLVQMSASTETPDPATDPRALAVDLLVVNEKLIDEIKAAFDVATADREQGIANFLADRQDAHAKWGWQLRASLGLKKDSSKKEEKSVTPVIKVVEPAPSVKVLYVPPTAEQLAKGISEAVEKALSRKTGKLM